MTKNFDKLFALVQQMQGSEGIAVFDLRTVTDAVETTGELLGLLIEQFHFHQQSEFRQLQLLTMAAAKKPRKPRKRKGRKRTRG